jgi:hypothetical protein
MIVRRLACLCAVVVLAAGCSTSSTVSSGTSVGTLTTGGGSAAPASGGSADVGPLSLTATATGFEVGTPAGRVVVDGPAQVGASGAAIANWPSSFPLPPGSVPVGPGNAPDTPGAMVGVFRAGVSAAAAYAFYRASTSLPVKAAGDNGQTGESFRAAVRFGGMFLGSVTVVTVGAKVLLVIVLTNS